MQAVPLCFGSGRLRIPVAIIHSRVRKRLSSSESSSPASTSLRIRSSSVEWSKFVIILRERSTVEGPSRAPQGGEPAPPSPPNSRSAVLVLKDAEPEGVPPFDLPSQPAVFAPDYAPEEIAEIAEKLRKQAGLSKNPTGEVANAGRVSPKPRRAGRATAGSKK